MSKRDDDEKLQLALKALLRLYKTTEQSLDNMKHSPRGEVDQDVLKQVFELLASNDTTYRTVLAEWNRPECVPSEESKQLRTQVEQLLGELVQRISLLEKQAAEGRARLLPQLNDAARDQQANSAYQRGSAF